MIEHLQDGSLQALLDDEMESCEALATREHLAGCPQCRERYADIRQSNDLVGSAIGLLDPALVGSGSVMARPPSATARTTRWRRSGAAKAAAVTLFVVAAASATVPGSPVRQWLFGASDVAVATIEEAQSTQAEGFSPAPATDESGVSVAVSEGRFEIAVTGAESGLAIDAELVEGSRGAVYYSAPLADPSFDIASGRIHIQNAGAAKLRVEIPDAASEASVVIDGTTYLTKQGAELRVLRGGAGSGPQVQLQVVR